MEKETMRKKQIVLEALKTAQNRVVDRLFPWEEAIRGLSGLDANEFKFIIGCLVNDGLVQKQTDDDGRNYYRLKS